MDYNTIKKITVNFTEWLAEQKYESFNKNQFWKTDLGVKTTDQLFDHYITINNIKLD